jgi:hypothetical protein
MKLQKTQLGSYLIVESNIAFLVYYVLYKVFGYIYPNYGHSYLYLQNKCKIPFYTNYPHLENNDIS